MEFLVRELIRATIVEDDELPPNTVTMGSKVEFREEGSKTNKVVTLAHPNESEFYDDAISVLSPAGAALIGLSEGQSISYGAPGGLLTTVTVVKVLYQPEANRRVEY
jgi:regulator of nucleoside diphosphate kinase